MPNIVPNKAYTQKRNRYDTRLVFWSIAIVFVLLFSVLMWQTVLVKWQRVSSHSNSLEVQQEKMKLLENRTNAAKNLITETDAIKGEDWRRLEQLLPSNPELPSLLVELNLIAQKSGWVLSLVSFSSEPKTAAPATSTLSSGSMASLIPQTQTFTVRLNIYGSSEYERFKEFLLSLENSLRLVSIQQFSYATNQENVTLVLEGYWYSSEFDDQEVEQILASLLSQEKKSTNLFIDKRFLSLERLSKDEYVYYPNSVYLKGETPGAPLGLTAYDTGYGKTILLTWNTPSEDTERIHVFRTTNPNNEGEEVVSLPESALYYVDKSVENSQPYYYFLTGSNAEGAMSSRSGVVSVRPQDRNAPGPIKNVVFDNSKEGEISLLWTHPTDSDFSHVNVYRTSGENETLKKVGTDIIESQFIDMVSTGAGEYYYFVSSVDQSGNESQIFSVRELLSQKIPFK